jgi:hypothetical protein
MGKEQSAPSLTSLIRRVRDELLAANRDVAEGGKPPLFLLKRVTLEVKFVVSQDESAQGKFDLKVVSIGGASAYSSEQVQTVTIELDPLETPISPDSPGKGGGGGGSGAGGKWPVMAPSRGD